MEQEWKLVTSKNRRRPKKVSQNNIKLQSRKRFAPTKQVKIKPKKHTNFPSSKLHTNWQTLAPECLLMIFDNIYDYKDLLSIELVCKAWRNAILLHWKKFIISSCIFSIRKFNETSIWEEREIEENYNYKKYIHLHELQINDKYDIYKKTLQAQKILSSEIEKFSLANQIKICKKLASILLPQSRLAWIPKIKKVPVGTVSKSKSKFRGYYALPYSDKYTMLFDCDDKKFRKAEKNDEIPNLIRHNTYSNPETIRTVLQINLNDVPKGMQKLFQSSNGLFQIITNGEFSDGRSNPLDIKSRIISNFNFNDLECLEYNDLLSDFEGDEEIIFGWKKFYDVTERKNISFSIDNVKFEIVLDCWSYFKIGGFPFGFLKLEKTLKAEGKENTFYSSPSVICKPSHLIHEATSSLLLNKNNVEFLGQVITQSWSGSYFISQIGMCSVCKNVFTTMLSDRSKLRLFVNPKIRYSSSRYYECIIPPIHGDHWEFIQSFDENNCVPKLKWLPLSKYPLCKKSDCYMHYKKGAELRFLPSMSIKQNSKFPSKLNYTIADLID